MRKQDIKQNIMKWCKEEGIFREERDDPNAKFNFLITYPKDIPHIMNIVQPKEGDDKIIVLCRTDVSPGHLEKMKGKTKRELDEFLWDLRFVLGNRPTEFNLKHSNSILESFMVSATIYLDGLTKDNFITALRNTYKSKLLAIWKIQQKFGPA